MNEQELLLVNLIKNDPWRMNILKTTRSLHLNDWVIGAGFVRNIVWDYLHNINNKFNSDIDIAYFDLQDLSEKTEDYYQEVLHKNMNAEWSVTNQARMATINNQSAQYISTEDALAHWPETATAVGVRLENDDSITIIAPYGLDDLFNLIVRMSPKFGDGIDDYNKRKLKKNWIAKWPKLKYVD